MNQLKVWGCEQDGSEMGVQLPSNRYSNSSESSKSECQNVPILNGVWIRAPTVFVNFKFTSSKFLIESVPEFAQVCCQRV